MNPLKKLASQTAIYGLPTIVGRLLNYFLTPLYTYLYSTSEFGDVTLAYAYVSFLLVCLTYGFETALFHFSQLEKKKEKVFATALISIVISSTAFVILCSAFSIPISQTLKFSGHPEYVVWFSLILAADAVSSVIFAQLRIQEKAKRFAAIRSLNIIINIGFNLFFIVFCRTVYESDSPLFKPLVEHIYNPAIGIGYIFIANLIASIATVILLLPNVARIKWSFDTDLWKKMLKYGIPLLIAGLAGMANETFDRVLIPQLLPGEFGKSQNGIYGACYKVAIIMTIFIQAFRFAAEPFFFNHSKETDAKKNLADIMKYFTIICSLIFLGTMLNLQWIQYFVGEKFREGLNVVPILLLANLFLGVFINQSIWYKLSGKTLYGALLTFLGAIITIGLNLWWIPIWGYTGSAWATLICYAAMMVASYILGNKHYPVNYDLKRIFGYLALSLSLYATCNAIVIESTTLRLIFNNIVLLGFITLLWKQEFKQLIAQENKN